MVRHDKAVRMTIDQWPYLRRQGGNYVVASVDQVETLKELGVHSKRIPSCVLPEPHVQANQGSEAALTARRDPDRDRCHGG